MKNVLATVLLGLILVGSAYVVGAEPDKSGATPRGQAKKADKEHPADTLKPKESSSEEDRLGPIAVFADIEDGWRHEKVEKILEHYGSGKVAISIAGTGPAGGEFSKNQSLYLLKDLFKYTITERFEFVQYRNVSDGKIKVYAVAERAYKRNDDGRPFEDKIYVSLQMEDDRWVISEIKSIR